MAALALLLGIFAILLALAGFLLTVVPYAGIACSALSVLCAVGGIVVGARAHSRDKAEGGDGTLALVALILNVVVFLGSLCILGTCGTCNALLTNSDGQGMRMYVSGPDGAILYYGDSEDGGVRVDPIFAPPTPDDPGEAPAPTPDDPSGAPPPALPPPPIAPGPASP